MVNFFLKILVLGISDIQNSTLYTKLLGKRFLSETLYSIGVEFGIKEIYLDNQLYYLQIWCINCQEKFEQLHTTYYYGCNGVIAVFDTQHPEKFIYIQNLISAVWQKNGKGIIPTIILGLDKYHNNFSIDKMSLETVQDYASHLSYQTKPFGFEVSYFDISRQNNDSFTSVFKNLIQNHLELSAPIPKRLSMHSLDQNFSAEIYYSIMNMEHTFIRRKYISIINTIDIAKDSFLIRFKTFINIKILKLNILNMFGYIIDSYYQYSEPREQVHYCLGCRRKCAGHGFFCDNCNFELNDFVEFLHFKEIWDDPLQIFLIVDEILTYNNIYNYEA